MQKLTGITERAVNKPLSSFQQQNTQHTDLWYTQITNTKKQMTIQNDLFTDNQQGTMPVERQVNTTEKGPVI